jgi:hypothetical protein
MHMSYISWYSVICLIPVLSPVEKIYLTSNISDPTKYCIIVACTVANGTATHACLTWFTVCYSYEGEG